VNLKELSDTEVIEIVNQLLNLGISAMTITGGEPLIRKDLTNRMLERLNQHDVSTTLNTNGYFLDHLVAESLAAAGLDKVQISLDSVSSRVHDSFRGEVGSHKHAANAVEHCVKAGIETHIRTTIIPTNFTEMTDILEFAMSKQASALVLKPLIPSGRGLDMKSELTHEQHRRAIEDVIEYVKKSSEIDSTYVEFLSPCFPFLVDPDFASSSEVCRCGESLAFITSTGDVQPCGYTHQVIGNILSTSLERLWTGSRFLEQWRQRRLGGKCVACEYVTVCRGGCRAAAYETTGELNSPDPLCWR
jgi:radical SAM protein with 4Fe4S-binding SPASM domain